MKTILVVDDDAHIRKLLHDMLDSQYRVIEAENGKAAMELMASQKPDLLITDRAMPEMGGLELLKRLQADNKAIPAIVISAYGEEEMWSQAIGSGAVEYLLKPFGAQEVLKVVQKYLDTHR